MVWTRSVVRFVRSELCVFVCSSAELEKYCALETTETDLQKRFKEEALRLRAAAQPPTNTIFTHIHREDFVAEYEVSAC